jgi:hypothetical protein
MGMIQGSFLASWAYYKYCEKLTRTDYEPIEPLYTGKYCVCPQMLIRSFEVELQFRRCPRFHTSEGTHDLV